MVGAAVVFIATSYAIPQAALVLRGREGALPHRTLNLGGWGIYINVASCVIVLCIDILYCMPTMYPVTLDNMNWIRFSPPSQLRLTVSNSIAA